MSDRFMHRPAAGVLLLAAAFPVLGQKAMPPAQPSLVPQTKPAVMAPKPALPAPAAVVLPTKALPEAAIPVGGKLVPTRPDIATGKVDIGRTGLPAVDLQGEKGKRLGMPDGRPGQMGVLGDGGKVEFDRDGLIGGNVIDGAKYGDTYGGERINAKHRGDTHDFAGGKGGQAATSPSDVGFPDVSKPQEGLGPAPVPYPTASGGGKGDGGGQGKALSVSPALTLKTEIKASQGDEPGTLEGIAGGATTGAKPVSGAAVKVIGTVPVRGVTTRRERDDAAGGGTGAPVGRSDVVNAQRAVGTRTGAAGGTGDGRGDANASGGGSGGPMRAQGTAGAAEREDKRGATVSMEEVLRINTQINPGRQ
jgi:hypothetical protein